jgi:hypothetical protein
MAAGKLLTVQQPCLLLWLLLPPSGKSLRLWSCVVLYKMMARKVKDEDTREMNEIQSSNYGN